MIPLHLGHYVVVTGHCRSMPGHPRLRRIRGMVATITQPDADEPDLVKIWPDDPIDDGKLWFCRRHARIQPYALRIHPSPHQRHTSARRFMRRSPRNHP